MSLPNKPKSAGAKLAHRVDPKAEGEVFERLGQLVVNSLIAHFSRLPLDELIGEYGDVKRHDVTTPLRVICLEEARGTPGIREKLGKSETQLVDEMVDEIIELVAGYAWSHPIEEGP